MDSKRYKSNRQKITKYMRRKFESEGDDLNIWVAFTDLMSNSFGSIVQTMLD